MRHLDGQHVSHILQESSAAKENTYSYQIGAIVRQKYSCVVNLWNVYRYINIQLHICDAAHLVGTPWTSGIAPKSWMGENGRASDGLSG